MPLKNGKNGSFPSESEKRKPSGSRANKGAASVTEARARAQRTKLDAQAEARLTEEEQAVVSETPKRKTARQDLQARRRTVAALIDEYVQDHEGGNHSAKTVEWHQTALGFMRTYFEEVLEITQIDDVEGPHISAWFSHMRKTPGGHGKVRSERTIQTYARSARAFFHWLVRCGTLTLNPFDRVVFPKVGRPLIQTITTEEFEKLLYACAPPHETGSFAERASRAQPGHSVAVVRHGYSCL